MSFLQILSTDKSSNPALRQLYRGHKPKIRLPPSPHPYVNYHEHQLSFSMRETHLQLNGLHMPPQYPPLKQKATSSASRSKYFLMKTSKTQEQIVTSSKQKVIPKHYSFSSYLATKGQSGKKNRTKQLRFFDLDEITQQMARPKRMSSKLSTEEQQKACHINLSSCKQELKNVDSDKDRYRHTQPSKRNISNSWLQNDFGKMKRKSLGGFQRNKRYSGGQQIIPWEQNQEQIQFDFREGNAQLLEFLPTS